MMDEFKKKATTTLLFPPGTTSTGQPAPTLQPGPDHEGYYHHIDAAGASGQRTLWVVFVIMLVSTLAFTAMAYRVSVEKRFFHVLTTFITLFATLSYFAMATGDGVVLKTVYKHFEHHGPPGLDGHHGGHRGNHGGHHGEDGFHYGQWEQREVYWARYVDWSVTTPLLLLDLGFLAGMNGASMLVAVVADIFMVLTGLFAAFGHNKGKIWGYYAMACIAYLVIVYQLVLNGRQAVRTKDNKTAKLFGSLAGFTLLLWTAYPIVWGVADGGRVANVDEEIIAYAVLDVLAKPIFGFWLLLAHDFTSATSVSIHGFWAHGASTDGTIRVGADDEGA